MSLVTLGRADFLRFVAIPTVMFRTPYIAVPLEFINTDVFREFGCPAEVDGLKDRLDGVLGDMVSPSNLGEGQRLYQGSGGWSHRKPASYAGRDGSSRESHRKRSDSPCTGACACGMNIPEHFPSPVRY